MRFPLLFFKKLSRLLPFVALLLTACSPYIRLLRGVRGRQVTVEPAVLEAVGDRVPVLVTVRVPAKRILKLEKKLTYKLEVSYYYNERADEPEKEYVNTVQFVPGDYLYDKDDAKYLIASRAMGFDYTPAKHPGHLVARDLVTRNGRDPRVFRRYGGPARPIAPGIITTARLVVHRNIVQFTPETYVPPTKPTVTQLPIYFPPGYAIFNAQYGTSASQLKEFVEDNLQTTSVLIEGGHSPEDAELKQPGLANTRALSVQKWYGILLDRFGYMNSSQSIDFRRQARKNDWTLLLERVQGSALPPAQVDRILDIVNQKWSYQRKADSLAAGPSAEYLQTYVYPMMRNAVVTIEHAPAAPRPDWQLYLIAKRVADGTEDPNALTEDELRYAASLTPLLEDKRLIYEAALQTGLSWPATHNLGLIYLQMAQREVTPHVKEVLLSKAVRNLTFAAHRNPLSAELWYHLATGQEKLGNTLEALHAYDYAVKASGDATLMPQIFADKAALELTVGQVDDALASMQYAEHSYQTVMNSGLAHLLKGDYPGAAALYEEAIGMNPPDQGALAAYCRAVTAARAKDDTALGQWLRTAVQLDPTAGSRAAQDLEFRDYVNSQLMLDALRK